MKCIFKRTVRLLALLVILLQSFQAKAQDQSNYINKSKLAASFGIPVFYVGIDEIELDVYSFHGNYKVFGLEIKFLLEGERYMTTSKEMYSGVIPEEYVVNDSFQILGVKTNEGRLYMKCEYDDSGRLISKTYIGPNGLSHKLVTYTFNDDDNSCQMIDTNPINDDTTGITKYIFDENDRIIIKDQLKYSKYKQIQRYSYNDYGLIDTVIVDYYAGSVGTGYYFEYEMNDSLDWTTISVYYLHAEEKKATFIFNRILK